VPFGAASPGDGAALTEQIRGMAMTEQAIGTSPGLNAGLGARNGNENRLVLRLDAVADRPPAQVDCAARMSICQGVCCKLEFALTREEVLAGQVQWDLARPFFVGRAPDGYCVHNDRSSGGCTVYAGRPAICRRWSCANDPRIWKDFEQMELNVEWLSAHGFIFEGWALTTPSPDGASTPHTKHRR
jgi:Fe-S-cluster containining protein